MKGQRVGRKSTCSKCGQQLDLNRAGRYRYCLTCHNAYMRATRKPYGDMSDEEKVKARCRSVLKMAVKRGKVARQPCEICGLEKSEAHHTDYSKPYLVKWLCKKHHIQQHKSKTAT